MYPGSSVHLVHAAVLQLALHVVALGMEPGDQAARHVERLRIQVAQVRPVLAAGVQVQVKHRAVLRYFSVRHVVVPVRK